MRNTIVNRDRLPSYFATIPLPPTSACIMPQGFGKPQPTKIDKLVERARKYCHQRSPERLDSIFDNLPVELNERVLVGILAALRTDTDTLAWFCGYLAGAINKSEDNDKPPHSITLLSKLLIKHGMQPFADFSPYPGCRLMILNTEKFETLPEKVQALLQETFDVTERTPEEAQQVNDALMQELMMG